MESTYSFCLVHLLFSILFIGMADNNDASPFPEAPSGETKVECTYCKTLYKLSKTGSTSTLKRHLESCKKRTRTEKGQKQISLEPIPGEEGNAIITNFKYDREKSKRILAKMIIVDEKPFRFVESKLFNLYSKTLQPRHDKWSRHAIRKECLKIYEEEKVKINNDLKDVTLVCLTIDCWTSRRTKAYICVTAHYVKKSWKLQKKILAFYHFPPPHTGQAMATIITEFMREWSLEGKVFTITVDNAASNDSMINILKGGFLNSGTLHLPNIFHMRCSAHILNLIVQYGLKHIEGLIHTVRETTKYVKSFSNRKLDFETSLAQFNLTGKKELILDVQTRWNSTYLMLKAAKDVRPAFAHYRDIDSNYKWCPSNEDWKKYADIEELLEKFYHATEMISGSKYPTSNLFLPVMWRIKCSLTRELKYEQAYMEPMIKAMQEKFEKYWSECNLVLAIATILYPRCKLMMIKFCFPQIYKERAKIELKKVMDAFTDIYDIYTIRSDSDAYDLGIMDVGPENNCYNMFDDNAYNKFVQEVEKNKETSKSEIDTYLEDPIEKVAKEAEFDLLDYWKHNANKYKILSAIAKDILSIPLITVASESAFSTGERLISEHRSSLKSETVEALICSQDWLRPMYLDYDESEEQEE